MESLNLGKLYAILLTTLLVSGLVRANGLVVTVDGKKLETIPRPIIRQGRIFVPVDSIRRIGLRVDWRKGKRKAEVAWPETDVFIYFEANRGTYPGGQSQEQEKINEKSRRVSPSSFMDNGVLMVPLSALVRLSGEGMLTLEWDKRAGIVNLRRPPYWVKWRRGLRMNDSRYGPVL